MLFSQSGDSHTLSRVDSSLFGKIDDFSVFFFKIYFESSSPVRKAVKRKIICSIVSSTQHCVNLLI